MVSYTLERDERCMATVLIMTYRGRTTELFISDRVKMLGGLDSEINYQFNKYKHSIDTMLDIKGTGF